MSAYQLIGRCQNRAKERWPDLAFKDPKNRMKYTSFSNIFVLSCDFKQNTWSIIVFQPEWTMILLKGMKSRVKGVMK